MRRFAPQELGNRPFPQRAVHLTLTIAAGLVLTQMAAAAQTQCLDCHELDPATLEASVHAGFDCTDCHAGAETQPHEPGPVDCATCHDEVTEAYRGSVHGLSSGNGDAPVCASCHGPIHEVRPASDPASPVHPDRLPETCGHCHSNPELIARYGIPVALPIEAYRQSVHARRRAEGALGATCSSCHNSHAIYGAQDARSTVNAQRVPETCGHCHAKIATAYRKSVHGSASSHGAREAPNCTDCHGEHRILAPSQSDSPVFATNIPRMTCGRCHGDLRLAEKYGISGGTVPAYEDSYHGLAMRSGTATVAHCGSCHGIHNILPSSDPDSSVHPDNLASTCGTCHPGAGERFAIGAVHTLATERRFPGVFYIRLVYLWMIYLTIGGMVLHNLLDLYRKARDPHTLPVASRAPRERMSRGFRIAHGLLGVNFIVLVYTGFALKYSEAWWARPLLHWESVLGLRGGLHRIASVGLLLALGIHLAHLAIDARARACIAGMRPGKNDWIHLRERLRYYLGKRRTAPRAAHLDYPEKLEYIALLWGIAIMCFTGFVLWFDNLALRYLPKWTIDVATVIHFYEAVLATLAILVWHLYFVIFDPVVYPMDPAWWSGRSAPGREQERDGSEDVRP